MLAIAVNSISTNVSDLCLVFLSFQQCGLHMLWYFASQGFFNGLWIMHMTGEVLQLGILKYFTKWPEMQTTTTYANHEDLLNVKRCKAPQLMI